MTINLFLNEAVNMAQNHPLWRLMSTVGATLSQWCMTEMMRTISCCFDLSDIIFFLWPHALSVICHLSLAHWVLLCWCQYVQTSVPVWSR